LIRVANFDDVCFIAVCPLGRALPIVLEVCAVPAERACRERLACRQGRTVKHVVGLVADAERLVRAVFVLDKSRNVRRVDEILVAVVVEIFGCTLVDFVLRGLCEQLVSVGILACIRERIDDCVCRAARRIGERRAERVRTACKLQSHKVGQSCHILAARLIDVKRECFCRIRSVRISVIAFERLQFEVVGDVDGDCVKHRVERIAVDIACKTSTFTVRARCRREIHACRIPNDLRTGCVFIRACRIVGRERFALFVESRERHRRFLREERRIEEVTVSELEVLLLTFFDDITRSRCGIFYDDFGRSRTADGFCVVGVVELDKTRRVCLFNRAVRSYTEHEEVPCPAEIGGGFVGCAAAVLHKLHACHVVGLGFVVKHARAAACTAV